MVSIMKLAVAGRKLMEVSSKRSRVTTCAIFASVLTGPLELSSRSHTGALWRCPGGGRASSWSQPRHPWLFACFLRTEEALAHICLNNHLSFMAIGQKSWATFLRISILKKSWHVDASCSSKSELKENIVEDFWVEEFWRVFMRNNYSAEWNSLVQTSLSLHMLQVRSWRAVVSELLACYFAFQVMSLIWLMHFSCQLFPPLTVALDKNDVVSV